MSHFTVMVIGDNPENQLKPFQENNMGDCPKKYLQWLSVSDEYDTTADAVKDGYGLMDGIPGYWENPNSKWDWYTLGGRWSGLISLKKGKIGVAGNAGVFGNTTGIDQAKKSEISNLEEICTFAIIKGGKWFERGEMGWWGSVSNEKDDAKWDAEFKTLMGEIKDDSLISIYDCNI